MCVVGRTQIRRMGSENQSTVELRHWHFANAFAKAFSFGSMANVKRPKHDLGDFGGDDIRHALHERPPRAHRSAERDNIFGVHLPAVGRACESRPVASARAHARCGG